MHHGGNQLWLLFSVAFNQVNTVLEITVGHRPFSDQFQYLADQNPFWSALFLVHFQ